MSDKKQYAERDIIGLDEKGGYYFRHVDAMTGERLHGKSDIAAELGYRDMLIATYRQLCVDMLEALQYVTSSDTVSMHVKYTVSEYINKAEQQLNGEKK